MKHPSKLLVVLATYNEIDNLPRLVLQLDQLLPEADLLVIDDGSPDGTGNWCEQAIGEFSQLSVIHREGKLGLGSAARVGFEYACDNHYEFVATMDADLSHDPNSLVDMVRLIQADDGCGLVIGSRYVPNGGTEGWPWFRRLTSRVLNHFARLVLQLKTRDNSGAFRVYRVCELEKMDLANLKCNDFAYLEEIIWRLKKLRVKMIEHPIVFCNRELGRSKTNPLLGVSVFWQILKMGLGILK